LCDRDIATIDKCGVGMNVIEDLLEKGICLGDGLFCLLLERGYRLPGLRGPLHIAGFFFNKRKDIDYNKKKRKKVKGKNTVIMTIYFVCLFVFFFKSVHLC
jgi:hypothetical protein